MLRVHSNIWTDVMLTLQIVIDHLAVRFEKSLLLVSRQGLQGVTV
jgi:hypothetical protein